MISNQKPAGINEECCLLAVLSGVLLFLSFPKYGSGWLAWIAFVPLFSLCGRLLQLLRVSFRFYHRNCQLYRNNLLDCICSYKLWLFAFISWYYIDVAPGLLSKYLHSFVCRRNCLFPGKSCPLYSSACFVGLF